MKIIKKEWRAAKHVIGFIAYETENPAAPGQWNSVVGYVPDTLTLGFNSDEMAVQVPFGGSSEDFDAAYIAANGAKLDWKIARVLWPDLDYKKHKYYDGIWPGDLHCPDCEC